MLNGSIEYAIAKTNRPMQSSQSLKPCFIYYIILLFIWLLYFFGFKHMPLDGSGRTAQSKKAPAWC